MKYDKHTHEDDCEKAIAIIRKLVNGYTSEVSYWKMRATLEEAEQVVQRLSDRTFQLQSQVK